jgi:hypothetical protein
MQVIFVESWGQKNGHLLFSCACIHVVRALCCQSDFWGLSVDDNAMWTVAIVLTCSQAPNPLSCLKKKKKVVNPASTEEVRPQLLLNYFALFCFDLCISLYWQILQDLLLMSTLLGVLVNFCLCFCRRKARKKMEQ